MTDSPSAMSGDPPSFLIVDDSPTMRKMIIAALHPMHPMCWEAGSGLEAIEQMTLRPYSAVLLDLNMPDIHGLEFLRFVHANPALRDTPVVVVTTRTDDEIRRASLEAGAMRFITKPFQPQELLDAAQAALRVTG